MENKRSSAVFKLQQLLCRNKVALSAIFERKNNFARKRDEKLSRENSEIVSRFHII